MAKTFQLNILAPDKEFFQGEAEQIIFDTPKGRIGLMADHMAMLASVAEGLLEVCVDGKWQTAAVGQGFAEVGGGVADLFVDTVEWAEDIDVVRARQALERASERLSSDISHTEFLQSQAAMSRALARLRAAGGDK